jgi:hypothetical protein
VQLDVTFTPTEPLTSTISACTNFFSYSISGSEDERPMRRLRLPTVLRKLEIS